MESARRYRFQPVIHEEAARATTQMKNQRFEDAFDGSKAQGQRVSIKSMSFDDDDDDEIDS
jgi:hypothetical protein